MGKNKRKYRWLRRTARVLAVLFAVFILLVLFVRSSWGQDIIVSKVTDYISNKTNTAVTIDKLFIGFSGNIILEGLYLEDIVGDTLVYSKSLEANLPLRPLLFGNEINVKSVSWDGLKANISRTENSEDFNFSFFVDALVPQDTVTPATASAPMEISVGKLDFTDFDLKYTDGFLGIESSLKLGKLLLDADKIDINTLRFELDGFRLADTKITYTQTKPFTAETDTVETDLPFISVNELVLNNVTANYNSLPDAIGAQVVLGRLNLELPKADLSKNIFEIDALALDNSTISLQVPNTSSETQDTSGNLASNTVLWPEYRITASEIALKNNTIHYSVGNTKPQEGQFSPDAMAYSDMTLEISDVSYEPKNLVLDVEQFSFVEKSGFLLKNLQFTALVHDTKANLTNLQVRTKNSSLSGSAFLEYASLQDLVKTPGNTSLDIKLPNLTVVLSDAFIFSPELEQNKYVQTLARYPISGNLKAKGTLNSLQLMDTQFHWGENTDFSANMELYQVLRPDSISFDVASLKATSTKEDILNFFSEKELGISIPATVLVEASGKGSLNRIRAEAKVSIPEGNAMLTGSYDGSNRNRFSGNLMVDSLRLDKLLQNPQLGGLAFTMMVEGGGKNLNTLDAVLETDFSQLDIADYDFSNLDINGKITNGVGNVNLSFEDKNLHLDSNVALALDSIAPKIGLDLNLIGADLYALGLTKGQIKMGMNVKADFQGNTSDFELDAKIQDGLVVYNNKQYQVDDIRLASQIDAQSTEIRVDSDFLKGALSSNAAPNEITSALTGQLKNYFRDSTKIVPVSDSVRVQINLRLRPNPVLTEVFFRDTEQLDSITIRADFDAIAQKISAEIHVPIAKYNGSSVDSLNVSILGDSSNLSFSAGFSKLLAQPINIKKTVFNGRLKDKKLRLNFTSADEGERVVNIDSEMRYTKDSLQLRILPENLIFNKKDWSVPEDNEIVLATDYLAFNNVTLSRNTQELMFSNTMSGIDKEHLGIRFTDFRLQTFLSLLNPDEELITGQVNGDFIVENPFGATGLVADFKVAQLHVFDAPLGDLSFKAAAMNSAAYDFNLSLNGGGADLDLIGNYTVGETGAVLDLDLDMNRLDMKFIESFTDGAVTESNGAISGQISLSGTTAAPEYSGSINFNSVGFKLASINAAFKIPNETLELDSEGIYLNNFEIEDANNSSFTLDGNIGTENIVNPSFDLKLKTEKFSVLNSSKEDNELFYGNANLDADITVKGDLQLPIIKGKLRIRKVTDVTYVVAESQLDVEEREGVVIFVNRENTDAILTRKDNEETTAFFRGMDVQAVLEIADDAVFKIIIDERTGDQLQVSGNAALNLNIEPNGRINLSGRYVLNSGFYAASLYNLVNRRFEIKTGSSITWNGSPTDASLDVTAIYDLETSAAPLMSSVTSGQHVSVSGKYRQVLPFKVYLNVDGELLTPELSFGLDMPEDEQGSLGGAVYSRVQQLNQEEAQLNKQVFSLLALNRFYPDSGSDGSAGGTAAFARDNVNDLLSGELNTFSDKLLGDSGFELDFDLDSFTDYQGDNPQNRTQLNINARKKLFNDRLIVTAGSAVDVEGSAQPGQDETPIIGNVSLEYLLTKNGQYRLRGFRKNEYENIIDGQLIVTGVALILNREFNKFSQLFNPLTEENDESVEKDSETKKEKE